MIGRMAKAFVGLRSAHPGLIADRRVVVRLVSNQPLDSRVTEALSKPPSYASSSNQHQAWQSDRAALVNATRLTQQDFDAFAELLDLSECGHGSRFTLEERILTQISEWIDDDARATVDHLMRFIRRSMMPELNGRVDHAPFDPDADGLLRSAWTVPVSAGDRERVSVDSARRIAYRRGVHAMRRSTHLPARRRRMWKDDGAAGNHHPLAGGLGCRRLRLLRRWAIPRRTPTDIARRMPSFSSRTILRPACAFRFS